MLDRLSSQVYFSQIYVLALVLNVFLVYLERLASLVYILFESTLSLAIERDLLFLSILEPTYLLHGSIVVEYIS